MCLGTAPLWTFQNKTNTENPATDDSLNANDSADLHVPEISTEGLNEVNKVHSSNIFIQEISVLIPLYVCHVCFVLFCFLESRGCFDIRLWIHF
jgi:hypothetical protein